MTITKRTGLGRPMSWSELDANWDQVEESTAAAQQSAALAAASQAAAATSESNAAASASEASSQAAAAAALRTDLASTDEGKGLSLSVAEDGTTGQEFYDKADQFAGAYEDSVITITSVNRWITYNGSRWYVKPGTIVPFSTTGLNDTSWEADSVKFVPSGDVVEQKLTHVGRGQAAAAIPLAQGGYIQDALLKVIVPEMYGAVGDGVTDDTDALEAMFAYIESNGYCDVRLSGQYLYSKPLQCHYIQSANYGVTIQGVTPYAGFVWNGASGQNTLDLTISIHGYRLVARDFRVINNTTTYDTFTATRFAGEEHTIDNITYRGKWKTSYWGVIQNLSVISNLNIQNDTRVASDSTIDPVGIGVRLNSCLNTVLNGCRISYNAYMWKTGYLEDGQTTADILPSSYSGTVTFGCEGIRLVGCSGTSNYYGVTLVGTDMQALYCMVDICKYTWIGVYGNSVKIVGCYFGIVSSYDYSTTSRLYVIGSGVYNLQLIGNSFFGSSTSQSMVRIPNTAHFVTYVSNVLSYHDFILNTSSGTNKVSLNDYDTNTSSITLPSSATFSVTDWVDFMTYIRYGGQILIGASATDPGGQLVIQPISSRFGFIQTQAGVRTVVTAPGNAGVVAANTANQSVLYLGSSSGTGRSLSATGTLNASGADYAEYFTKAEGCGTVTAGDLVGINADRKITQKYSESVHFLIKSTNPSYVGGDSWASGLDPMPEFSGDTEELGINDADTSTYTPEYTTYKANLATWEAAREVVRATVDRLALCGQVPVNITTGAVAGYLMIPTAGENDTINASFVSLTDVTFDQFKTSIGKVISVAKDKVVVLV